MPSVDLCRCRKVEEKERGSRRLVRGAGNGNEPRSIPLPDKVLLLEWGSRTGRHACTIFYYCSGYACSPASCTLSAEAFVAVRDMAGSLVG